MKKKVRKLINSIKRFIWWKIIPLRILRWFRDEKFNSLSERDKRMRKWLPFESRPGYDFYKFEMTREMALFIKRLRCREPFGYSWRAVSVQVYDNFPEMREHVLRDSQIEGKDICDYAMKFLGENEEDGWN